jgi:hypothetical protein
MMYVAAAPFRPSPCIALLLDTTSFRFEWAPGHKISYFIRFQDPSRRRPIRRSDVATQTAPRVKITKRKADAETETSRSDPKRAKAMKPTASTLSPKNRSVFHTTDHLMVREWAYDDSGTGSNGLDDEMKADSSPAFSTLKLDLDREVPADISSAVKKTLSICSVMEKQLLWYWGDSDCNWWPFLVEISASQRANGATIPSILLTSLFLSENTGASRRYQHMATDQLAEQSVLLCQMYFSKILRRNRIFSTLIKKNLQLHHGETPRHSSSRLTQHQGRS